MPEGLVIAGAGGVGREILDIIEAIEESGVELGFVGFLDDGAVDEELLARRGARVVGRTSDFRRVADRYVIGIGSSVARARVAEQIDPAGLFAMSLVHPAATVGRDTDIGHGSVLAAGARVTTNVRIGRHVQIHVNSTVGHDATIGACTTILPGATIGGSTQISEQVTVGAGSNVLQGLSIGRSAFIGAGAVVTRSVRSESIVVGVPARAMKTSETEGGE